MSSMLKRSLVTCCVLASLSGAACSTPTTMQTSERQAAQTSSSVQQSSPETNNRTASVSSPEMLTGGDFRHLRAWAGKYPFSSRAEGAPQTEGNFLELPEVSRPLRALIGAARFKRLQDGYYLISPIELVGDSLVLDFPPNNRLNTESDRVFVILDLGDGALHAAVQQQNGQARWQHNKSQIVSPAILRKYDLTGETPMQEQTGDTVPPQIEIKTPTANHTTREATINVSGSVFDPNENASGVARVTVNGREAQRDVMEGKWTLSNIELTPGENTITVVAIDHAGNAATKTLKVTRR